MKLLLVNNDTDTWQELHDLCIRSGYDVTPIHCLDVTRTAAEGFDVVVLSGGYWYDDTEKHLATYAGELDLIRTTSVPVVGICLGMQLMHVAYNGDVPLLDQPQNGLQRIAVTALGQELLGLPSTIEAHKNHTRGIRLVDPAFAVLATSPGHIEIMLHSSRHLLGVQFHPELGDTASNTALFRTLLQHAGAAVPLVPHLGLRITPATKTLDSTWYTALVDAAGVASEVYTLLGPTAAQLAAAKAEFLGAEKRTNPNLRPAEFAVAGVERSRAELERLLFRVTGEEENASVRSAYERCITELIQKIDMLFAAQRGDSAAFALLNDLVYGQPDRAVYAAAIAYFRVRATKYVHNANSSVQAAAAGVLEVLPNMDTKPAKLQPDDVTFQALRARHMDTDGFYTQLFDGTLLPVQETVDTQTGDRLLRQLLKNIGASTYGITTTDDGFWGVRYHPTCIVRPAEYELPRGAFIGTVGHEIGSHLLERLNGADQSLQLLGFGLQGYEAGNEGRAVLREQVVYDNWQTWAEQRRWHDILLRHLSISAALGLDRGHGRSFAETFAFVQPIELLWELTHGADSEAEQYATDCTWDLLARSLKGTDGTGGAYHKDIVYLEGNRACWQLAATSPGLVMAGDRGKFSVVNPEHLQLLKSIGIRLQ